MEYTSIISLIIFITGISSLITVIKYIIKEGDTKKQKYSTVFIEMINSLKYEKAVLDNNYAVYTGELEDNDTNEFIKYIDSGVLEIFKNKEEV